MVPCRWSNHDRLEIGYRWITARGVVRECCAGSLERASDGHLLPVPEQVGMEGHAGQYGRANSNGGAMTKRPEDEKTPEDELSEEDKETLEDLEKQHVPPKDDAD